MYNNNLIVYGDQTVQVPAHLNFGKFMLDKLRLYKNEIALENADTHETLTYEELTQYAVGLSCALKKLGVGLGDTVALGSEKRLEFVPSALAIIFTGATYTPYDLKSGRAILKHKLSITKPKYFICTNLFWNTYEDLLKTFDCIKHFITLDEKTDSLISVKSILSHVDVNNFEPERVRGQDDVAFVLYSSGTTGMPKGVQLTHLNCILNSLPHEFPNLQNILQGYGMTECGEPTSESWGTKGPRPGSVGMPSPGLIIKIVDPQTNEIVGPNTQGEIRVAGPVFMKGYIGIDPATYLDEQGFFKTGDLGYYDEDKYFFIVDRMKEIIVYDGYKVAPLELESILLAHPKVLEAAVVGKIVPDFGEEPTAFVVKQPGVDVTETELVDYVAAEVSPYMQLRGGVRFIDKIPRNTRGKVLRRNLREILNGGINFNS
ncbi:luciferin 4-monooxygenase-like isoform X2 [Plodia interpunctella]|uniref:luciferin 4-monooxygenase-like isoform X2 n=1 Tax=Plodia interpunctella TaxID=58824 RepID=UPI002368A5C5|nr:luciferin 4-monooxygenase-like isoform X2 [Plodia interpunctella]